MKPADDLKKRIGQMSETTGRDLDERVIASIREAMTGSPRRMISLPVKLIAAAALIALTVLLLVSQLSRKPEPPKEPRAVLSVGEMLTVKHLNVAYRRGGMQALDALCEEAAERVDLKPKETTVDKLIAELNGT